MIRLTNVRTHNLKNLSLEIPYGQWLSICGVSGSGKSSLAFDTLFAEGQRRYLECLAPATRKMLTLLDRPDADQIEGIPPAIAIQPRQGTPDRKTTVGNATDLIDYLRILYAQLGQGHCPVCQTPLRRWNADQIEQWLQGFSLGSRYMVTFCREIAVVNDLEQEIVSGLRKGFLRGIYRDELLDLNQPEIALGADPRSILSGTGNDRLFIVVDRLVAGSSAPSRVRESLELAFQCGEGACQVWWDSRAREGEIADRESGPVAEVTTVSRQSYQRFHFANQAVCVPCQRTLPQPDPALFNYHKPANACPECQGVGYSDRWLRQTCTVCGGSRLLPESLAFRLQGQHIGQLSQWPVEQLSQWAFWDGSQLTSGQRQRVEPVLEQIRNRLGFLQQVGLGHLNLNRPLITLSEGEQQRVLLTSCLGNSLANMLYVLDEPTRGLHSSDVERLIESIRQLQQRGNTVLVVDHRDSLLSAAERIVEIGPGAGEAGGELVFDGTPAELIQASTVTADFL
jgi:excinuclease ABC subunit A